MNLDKGDRIVIKIGTECLKIGNQNRVNKDVILHICGKVAGLYNQGYQPIVITSGAVLAGMEKRGIVERPEDTIELQSLAARGQPVLMALYEHFLNRCGLGAAQIIFTHRDLEDRRSRASIVQVIDDCHKNGEIAVLNENDPASNEELKREAKRKSYYFGDNDMLSFLLARYAEAKIDMMFNPHGGLYNNRHQLIEEVRSGDFDRIGRMIRGRDKSTHGRGGLTTKMEAFHNCIRNGIVGVLTNSKYLTYVGMSIQDILNKKGFDRTIFYPADK